MTGPRGPHQGQLVLSLFPGIGLLDMAFEEEGFTVVRGPDLLWGGDIRRFHPPAGKFDGVIGGPPCQMFSMLARLNQAQGRAPRYGNLIPEFARCVEEAAPSWFLMENVKAAPPPSVTGYGSWSLTLNNRWLGEEQNRTRRFTFGQPGSARVLEVETLALESAMYADTIISGSGNGPNAKARLRRGLPAVTGNVGGRRDRKPRVPGVVTSSDGGASVRMMRYSIEEACVLQGLPADFAAHFPFTKEAKLQALANGVPLPMGRAVARAVKRALGLEVQVPS